MPSRFGYGVAVDAGSSGSRIYLYRWPMRQLDDPRAFVKVEQDAVFSEERTPGVNDEDGVGLSHLEELISLAKDALPSDVDQSRVPIYLGATAGMRIIDSESEDGIMKEIRSLLHTSGFLFHDNWARTISGEEEGIYDWLVANYLKNGGNFPSSPTTTYGALDLGGASTQISFPVSDAMDEGGNFPMRIDSTEYTLFTQSFLYYGVDQARRQYDEDFASVTNVNPCYPKGFIDGDSHVTGGSNWKECLDSVAIFFDQSTNCKAGIGEVKGGCLLDGAQESQFNRKFISMSAFVYTWDYLGLKTGPDTDDLATLDSRASHICNLTHKQQINQYNRKMESIPSNRVTSKPHAQCFNAAFTYHLLSKGYGMPVSRTPIEIHFDFNGTKVQWALGLMLVEANKIGRVLRQGGLRYLPGMPNSIDNACAYFIISLAILIVFTRVINKLKPIQESCLPLLRLNRPENPRKWR